MKRSKRIFLLTTLVFLALIFYASYDIARRTTFPGSKPQLKERLKNVYVPDTTGRDTVTNRKPQ